MFGVEVDTSHIGISFLWKSICYRGGSTDSGAPPPQPTGKGFEGIDLQTAIWSPAVKSSDSTPAPLSSGWRPEGVIPGVSLNVTPTPPSSTPPASTPTSTLETAPIPTPQQPTPPPTPTQPKYVEPKQEAFKPNEYQKSTLKSYGLKEQDWNDLGQRGDVTRGGEATQAEMDTNVYDYSVKKLNELDSQPRVNLSKHQQNELDIAKAIITLRDEQGGGNLNAIMNANARLAQAYNNEAVNWNTKQATDYGQRVWGLPKEVANAWPTKMWSPGDIDGVYNAYMTGGLRFTHEMAQFLYKLSGGTDIEADWAKAFFSGQLGDGAYKPDIIKNAESYFTSSTQAAGVKTDAMKMDLVTKSLILFPSMTLGQAQNIVADYTGGNLSTGTIQGGIPVPDSPESGKELMAVLDKLSANANPELFAEQKYFLTGIKKGQPAEKGHIVEDPFYPGVYRIQYTNEEITELMAAHPDWKLDEITYVIGATLTPAEIKSYRTAVTTGEIQENIKVNKEVELIKEKYTTVNADKTISRDLPRAIKDGISLKAIEYFTGISDKLTEYYKAIRTIERPDFKYSVEEWAKIGGKPEDREDSYKLDKIITDSGLSIAEIRSIFGAKAADGLDQVSIAIFKLKRDGITTINGLPIVETIRDLTTGVGISQLGQRIGIEWDKMKTQTVAGLSNFIQAHPEFTTEMLLEYFKQTDIDAVKALQNVGGKNRPKGGDDVVTPKNISNETAATITKLLKDDGVPITPAVLNSIYSAPPVDNYNLNSKGNLEWYGNYTSGNESYNAIYEMSPDYKRIYIYEIKPDGSKVPTGMRTDKDILSGCGGDVCYSYVGEYLGMIAWLKENGINKGDGFNKLFESAPATDTKKTTIDTSQANPIIKTPTQSGWESALASLQKLNIFAPESVYGAPPKDTWKINDAGFLEWEAEGYKFELNNNLNGAFITLLKDKDKPQSRVWRTMSYINKGCSANICMFDAAETKAAIQWLEDQGFKAGNDWKTIQLPSEEKPTISSVLTESQKRIVESASATNAEFERIMALPANSPELKKLAEKIKVLPVDKKDVSVLDSLIATLTGATSVAGETQKYRIGNPVTVTGEVKLDNLYGKKVDYEITINQNGTYTLKAKAPDGSDTIVTQKLGNFQLFTDKAFYDTQFALLAQDAMRKMGYQLDYTRGLWTVNDKKEFDKVVSGGYTVVVVGRDRECENCNDYGKELVINGIPQRFPTAKWIHVDKNDVAEFGIGSTGYMPVTYIYKDGKKLIEVDGQSVASKNDSVARSDVPAILTELGLNVINPMEFGEEAEVYAGIYGDIVAGIRSDVLSGKTVLSKEDAKALGIELPESIATTPTPEVKPPTPAAKPPTPSAETQRKEQAIISSQPRVPTPNAEGVVTFEDKDGKYTLTLDKRTGVVGVIDNGKEQTEYSVMHIIYYGEEDGKKIYGACGGNKCSNINNGRNKDVAVQELFEYVEDNNVPVFNENETLSDELSAWGGNTADNDKVLPPDLSGGDLYFGAVKEGYEPTMPKGTFEPVVVGGVETKAPEVKPSAVTGYVGIAPQNKGILYNGNYIDVNVYGIERWDEGKKVIANSAIIPKSIKVTNLGDGKIRVEWKTSIPTGGGVDLALRRNNQDTQSYEKTYTDAHDEGSSTEHSLILDTSEMDILNDRNYGFSINEWADTGGTAGGISIMLRGKDIDKLSDIFDKVNNEISVQPETIATTPTPPAPEVKPPTPEVATPPDLGSGNDLYFAAVKEGYEPTMPEGTFKPVVVEIKEPSSEVKPSAVTSKTPMPAPSAATPTNKLSIVSTSPYVDASKITVSPKHSDGYYQVYTFEWKTDTPMIGKIEVRGRNPRYGEEGEDKYISGFGRYDATPTTNHSLDIEILRLESGKRYDISFQSGGSRAELVDFADGAVPEFKIENLSRKDLSQLQSIINGDITESADKTLVVTSKTSIVLPELELEPPTPATKLPTPTVAMLPAEVIVGNKSIVMDIDEEGRIKQDKNIQDIQATFNKDGSVRLKWKTEIPTTSQVMMCEEGGLCSWTDINKDLVKEHDILVDNLKPNEPYHFTISSMDKDEEDHIAELQYKGGGDDLYLGAVTPGYVPTMPKGTFESVVAGGVETEAPKVKPPAPAVTSATVINKQEATTNWVTEYIRAELDNGKKSLQEITNDVNAMLKRQQVSGIDTGKPLDTIGITAQNAPEVESLYNKVRLEGITTRPQLDEYVKTLTALTGTKVSQETVNTVAKLIVIDSTASKRDAIITYTASRLASGDSLPDITSSLSGTTWEEDARNIGIDIANTSKIQTAIDSRKIANELYPPMPFNISKDNIDMTMNAILKEKGYSDTEIKTSKDLYDKSTLFKQQELEEKIFKPPTVSTGVSWLDPLAQGGITGAWEMALGIPMMLGAGYKVGTSFMKFEGGKPQFTPQNTLAESDKLVGGMVDYAGEVVSSAIANPLYGIPRAVVVLGVGGVLGETVKGVKGVPSKVGTVLSEIKGETIRQRGLAPSANIQYIKVPKGFEVLLDEIEIIKQDQAKVQQIIESDSPKVAREKLRNMLNPETAKVYDAVIEIMDKVGDYKVPTEQIRPIVNFGDVVRIGQDNGNAVKSVLQKYADALEIRGSMADWMQMKDVKGAYRPNDIDINITPNNKYGLTPQRLATELADEINKNSGKKVAHSPDGSSEVLINSKKAIDGHFVGTFGTSEFPPPLGIPAQRNFVTIDGINFEPVGNQIWHRGLEIIRPGAGKERGLMGPEAAGREWRLKDVYRFEVLVENIIDNLKKQGKDDIAKTVEANLKMLESSPRGEARPYTPEEFGQFEAEFLELFKELQEGSLHENVDMVVLHPNGTLTRYMSPAQKLDTGTVYHVTRDIRPYVEALKRGEKPRVGYILDENGKWIEATREIIDKDGNSVKVPIEELYTSPEAAFDRLYDINGGNIPENAGVIAIKTVNSDMTSGVMHPAFRVEQWSEPKLIDLGQVPDWLPKIGGKRIRPKGTQVVRAIYDEWVLNKGVELSPTDATSISLKKGATSEGLTGELKTRYNNKDYPVLYFATENAKKFAEAYPSQELAVRAPTSAMVRAINLMAIKASIGDILHPHLTKNIRISTKEGDLGTAGLIGFYQEPLKWKPKPLTGAKAVTFNTAIKAYLGKDELRLTKQQMVDEIARAYGLDPVEVVKTLNQKDIDASIAGTYNDVNGTIELKPTITESNLNNIVTGLHELLHDKLVDIINKDSSVAHLSKNDIFHEYADIYYMEKLTGYLDKDYLNQIYKEYRPTTPDLLYIEQNAKQYIDKFNIKQEMPISKLKSILEDISAKRVGKVLESKPLTKVLKSKIEKLAQTEPDQIEAIKQVVADESVKLADKAKDRFARKEVESFDEGLDKISNEELANIQRTLEGPELKPYIDEAIKSGRLPREYVVNLREIAKGLITPAISVIGASGTALAKPIKLEVATPPIESPTITTFETSIIEPSGLPISPTITDGIYGTIKSITEPISSTTTTRTPITPVITFPITPPTTPPVTTTVIPLTTPPPIPPITTPPIPPPTPPPRPKRVPPAQRLKELQAKYDVWPPPGSVCFPKGTSIAVKKITKTHSSNRKDYTSTICGTLPIETIKVGDEVLSYNIENGNKEFRKVTTIFHRESNAFTKVKYNNGVTLTCTPEHPIAVIDDKGKLLWVDAKDIKVGDKCIHVRQMGIGNLKRVGKTWEESFGIEKAKELKQAMALREVGNTKHNNYKYENVSEESKDRMKRYGNDYWVGRTHGESARRKIAKANRGRVHTEETRLRMSQAQLRIAADPEKLRKKMEGLYRYVRPTGLEKKLSYILRHVCPHEFKYNGDGRLGVMLDGLVPDFVNINGKKKIIEVYALFWKNRNKSRSYKNVDEYIEKRQARLAKIGYDSLFIDNTEFKDRDALKKKVITFVYNPNVEIVSVESIGSEHRANAVDVYNIEVEHNNNYFARGILVHNCWKQGIIYRHWFPPYGKADWYFSRKPIPGVPYETGFGSAYASIVKLGGEIPPELNHDMGLVSLKVVRGEKGNDPGIHFSLDEEDASWSPDRMAAKEAEKATEPKTEEKPQQITIEGQKYEAVEPVEKPKEIVVEGVKYKAVEEKPKVKRVRKPKVEEIPVVETTEVEQPPVEQVKAEEPAREVQLALRRGKIEPEGSYFATSGSSTYFDEEGEGLDKYDISDAKIVVSDTPEAKAILQIALLDKSNTPDSASRIKESLITGFIDYKMNDEIPSIVKTAKNEGYDGIKVWENDDVANPSSVFLWNTSKAKMQTEQNGIDVGQVNIETSRQPKREVSLLEKFDNWDKAIGGGTDIEKSFENWDKQINKESGITEKPLIASTNELTLTEKMEKGDMGAGNVEAAFERYDAAMAKEPVIVQPIQQPKPETPKVEFSGQSAPTMDDIKNMMKQAKTKKEYKPVAIKF